MQGKEPLHLTAVSTHAIYSYIHWSNTLQSYLIFNFSSHQYFTGYSFSVAVLSTEVCGSNPLERALHNGGLAVVANLFAS